jgi:hypothetical protein
MMENKFGIVNGVTEGEKSGHGGGAEEVVLGGGSVKSGEKNTNKG